MRSVRLAGTWLAGLLLLATANAANDIETYRLTEDGLEKYELATEAMYKYAVDHPEAMQAMEAEQEKTESDDVDPASMARDMDRHAPGLRRAMEASGMPLEEYFTFSIALAANALGAAFAEHYGSQTKDMELTPLQRDNLAFAQKHMPRFQAFGERMQEKYGAFMDDDEEYDEEYDEYEDYAEEDDPEAESEY